MIMDKEFYKNIFTMFTGTSASQLIWIFTIPFLTRIFSADDFGIYQLFLSTTSIIIIFSTARYDLAVIVPEEKNKAISLMVLPVIISLFCSLALIVMTNSLTPTTLTIISIASLAMNFILSFIILWACQGMMNGRELKSD